MSTPRPDLFVVALLVAALLYWSFALCPSSYAAVLRNFGAEETGLILGQPRPIRSDEFAIWTPQVQIAVHNHFRRYNETSPYHEDLRTPYSLPLRDWGLVFKPQFWLFLFASPAYAYSFYHVVHAVAFLLGYYLLLQRFGFRRSWAALSSLALFFSSFVQFWWASLGEHPAILPWVLLCFLSGLRASVKTGLLTYLFTVWMLSAQFYPPFVLSLGLAGGFAILAFRPDTITPRSAGAVILAAISAAALSALYFEDALPRILASHSHGDRHIAGGGVPLLSWMAQFFPMISIDNYKSLSDQNLCEASTLGSYAVVLCLCFIDVRRTRQHWKACPESAQSYRRACIALALPFAVVSLWMLAPIPSRAGTPLLWHLFPNQRLFFASGLLLLLLTLATLRHGSVCWSPGRLLAFLAIVVGERVYSKIGLAGHPVRFSALAPYLPLALLALRAPASQLPTRILTAVAAVNVIAFAPFNPLQSAKPIFDRVDSIRTRALTRIARAHPRGWLVVGGPEYYGSVLNGLGFASISHALILPEVDFFRSFFPELGEAQLDEIFNRYAVVQVAARVPWNVSKTLDEPLVVGTSILVPPFPFSAVALRGERRGPRPTSPEPRGG